MNGSCCSRGRVGVESGLMGFMGDVPVYCGRMGGPLVIPPLKFKPKETVSKESKVKMVGPIYQLKVTLLELESEPRPWRRILVPDSINFHDLHVTLQRAFGWKNYHVFEFRFGSKRDQTVITYPPEELNNYNDGMWNGMYNEPKTTLIAKNVLIKEYLKNPKDKGLYAYDLGDKWHHKVLLEKIIAHEEGMTYPKCTAGELWAPPEDTGGPRQFDELMRGLRKPYAEKSEDEKEKQEWLDDLHPGYDPNSFTTYQIVF